MKGIILAGGAGTRLYPLTMVTSKQLLPVYDKPMIYYPLSTLMLAGIRDILIISTPEDTPRFEHLLGDGSHFGIQLRYAVQPSPDGLAQAFIIGKDFIGDEPCAMVLGDNIFYGNGFSRILKEAVANAEQGRAPGCGAVTVVYFYPSGGPAMAEAVKPSWRGELEITTLNDMYLQQDRLDVQLLGRGFAWLDTGTMESLLEAGDFVHMIEKRQGVTISAPEEIAYRSGWISTEELLESAKMYGKSPYGQHLTHVAENKVKSIR